MVQSTYSEDFKRDAVHQIVVRGYPVREGSQRLGVSIHPSGFYAWINNPLSMRAPKDARQIKLPKDAWKDSGKVYDYRKLHDDLVEQGGETGSPGGHTRPDRL